MRHGCAALFMWPMTESASTHREFSFGIELD